MNHAELNYGPIEAVAVHLHTAEDIGLSEIHAALVNALNCLCVLDVEVELLKEQIAALRSTVEGPADAQP